MKRFFLSGPRLKRLNMACTRSGRHSSVCACCVFCACLVLLMHLPRPVSYSEDDYFLVALLFLARAAIRPAITATTATVKSSGRESDSRLWVGVPTPTLMMGEVAKIFEM